MFSIKSFFHFSKEPISLFGALTANDSLLQNSDSVTNLGPHSHNVTAHTFHAYKPKDAEHSDHSNIP